MTLQQWMSGVQQRTEVALQTFLPQAGLNPARLHEAMRYATIGGGKRIRPLLCHAAGELFAAPAPLLDHPACAVEMIHAYSLVHDDLPCMDDDVLRRGQPTCHVKFDEATALLAGDALQSLAFQVLADSPAADTTILAMMRMLAHASGSRGMAGGQAIDLASTGQAMTIEELEYMHIHKTGALIRSALLMGAHCGTAKDEAIASLTHFANRIGLLFQVVDDLLDAEATTETLGKTAGKDAAQNKATYVNLLGLRQARDKAESLRTEAHASLTGFGHRATVLHHLTDYIVDRKF